MAYSHATTASNVVGGAGAGAAAGTAIMPGWGTAIGAGVGALVGVFTSIAEMDAEEQRREALAKLAASTNQSYDKLAKKFATFYDQYKNKIGGNENDLNEAAEKIRNFDYSKYDWLQNYDKNKDGVVSADEFQMDYDKEVSDFLNPYMDEVIDYSNRKVTASAAGAGLGRSTGAAEKIARNTAEQYNDLYNTALSAWENDRDFAYKQWSDYNAAMSNRLNNMMQVDQWQIGQQKQLGEDYMNWQSQALQTQADIERSKLETNAQITMAGI